MCLPRPFLNHIMAGCVKTVCVWLFVFRRYAWDASMSNISFPGVARMELLVAAPTPTAPHRGREAERQMKEREIKESEIGREGERQERSADTAASSFPLPQPHFLHNPLALSLSRSQTPYSSPGLATSPSRPTLRSKMPFNAGSVSVDSRDFTTFDEMKLNGSELPPPPPPTLPYPTLPYLALLCSPALLCHTPPCPTKP